MALGNNNNSIDNIYNNYDVKDNKKNHSQFRLMNAYVDTYTSLIQFYSRLNASFIDSLYSFMNAREDIRRELEAEESKEKIYVDLHSQQEVYKKVEKIILSKIRNRFDKNFRDKRFVTSLSGLIESYSNIAKITGAGRLYQNISNVNAFWNNTFVEPIRDSMYRTPSHKIYSESKYSLFHYDLPAKKDDDHDEKGSLVSKVQSEENNISSSFISDTSSLTPLLIIYSFINRHYILDILPNSSIIRNLQRQGFDIFATDWGTPSAYDKELTLGHYVNNYLARAVDYIVEHSHADKVSLLGYCWGGDLALMLAALHPEKIKNIVTFATPGDFSIDDNLLSVWARSINVNSLVDTFGNVPSTFINSAFYLRSPVDFLHKYPHFFTEGRVPDIESIMEFIATEIWLNDSPPVIGEIFRQFINDCYQNNLLIKNKMIIGGNNRPIDLSKIKHPFLNIIAKRDDLVAPSSSRSLNDVIESTDKSIIEFDSGHVGACISSRAHNELWPRVGNWLKDR